MIPAPKPYPAYKVSGESCLGEVPQHWRVEPIGRLGTMFKGNGGSKEDEVGAGVPCVRYGDLYTRHEFFIRDTKAFVTAERAPDYTAIRRGDLLFAASGETIEDIGRSAVNLITATACCGGDVLVLRPKVDAVPEFLGYTCDAPSSRAQKSRMGRGFTVVHIYASELKRLAIPLPPLPEQHAIVRYLDYMDRRIRRYIRAKQKLLKLLEEQKQAIVEQGVLRGVEPDALRRDSEIGWMGIVPAHWQVRRAKTLFKEVDRRTTTGQETLLSLRMYSGLVPHETVSMVPIEPTALIGFKKVRPDQLVMNRMRAAIGLFGIAHEDGLVSPDYAVFDLAPDMDPEYALCVLKTRAAGSEFRRESKGLGTGSSGFMRLYTDRFGAVKLPLPSAEEQHRILDWISGETRQISAAEARVEREIGLLREYRARLIADLVTGKLDVRDAAAELPDEPEEDEPSDEADLLEEEDLLEPDDADADRGELS